VTQPVSSIRLPRALKLLLGPSFSEAVPYDLRIEGVGEDTFVRVYKRPDTYADVWRRQEAIDELRAPEPEPEEEPEYVPPPQPDTAAGEDCNARLSPDGTHYIHKHDCQRAIELGLPREPAPAPTPSTDDEPPFDPPYMSRAEFDANKPETPPAPAEPEMKGGRLAMRAAILCDEGGFRVFLGAADKDHAAEIIRTRCGITSRRELDHNDQAAAAFRKMTADYDLWLRDEL
jgi:hypothetical protein